MLSLGFSCQCGGLGFVSHPLGFRRLWGEAAEISQFTQSRVTVPANGEGATGNADKGVTVMNGVINKQLMFFRAWLQLFSQPGTQL